VSDPYDGIPSNIHADADRLGLHKSKPTKTERQLQALATAVLAWEAEASKAYIGTLPPSQKAIADMKLNAARAHMLQLAKEVNDDK